MVRTDWFFLQLAIHVVQNRRAGEQKSQGQDKQKTYKILNGNFLCLSCPCNVTFALQHGGFVPREWPAAKGLLSESTQYPALIIFSFLSSTCNRNTYFQTILRYSYP